MWLVRGVLYCRVGDMERGGGGLVQNSSGFPSVGGKRTTWKQTVTTFVIDDDTSMYLVANAKTKSCHSSKKKNLGRYGKIWVGRQTGNKHFFF